MNGSLSMTNEDFDNFFVVIEQVIESKIDRMEPITQGGLNFLRWRQCLQRANVRNRNGRLWPFKYLKAMTDAPIIQEYLRVGWFGEAGHPVPDVGKVTAERIMTVDPERVSHAVRSIEWEGDFLYGMMETLDDGPGGPGFKFMRHILQGFDPAVSARTLIPQRVNNDGTMDVIGPGNLRCYDRVLGPSHPEAYIDKSVPIKNIFKKADFETAVESMSCGMESFLGEFGEDMVRKSEKLKRILDRQKIVLESASMDKNGIFAVKAENVDGNGTPGVACIVPELKYRKEFSGYLNSLFN